MPFKLGGSTKSARDLGDTEVEDRPTQIGPLAMEQPLWPRTMPEPDEVDRLFSQVFALVGEAIAGATHALLAGDRDAAKELVKRRRGGRQADRADLDDRPAPARPRRDDGRRAPRVRGDPAHASRHGAQR